ncbi:rhomboid family protein [Cryptosporidium muris RN66]|uniref:Rhomboid family protein n=1 Tax=Cryptosporidium muris (strain RN66) TaxID=441375 RepID=B6ADY7_CRYMR|nr:rhomboid family protein [Cryptosporidium muris RN66]EEA06428.1 rhomboid family protein [Cryptosporidium muris RN66]|eukprot:XP_002140777.1 rhomboid family protein [Cryptosporidium muris RN66]
MDGKRRNNSKVVPLITKYPILDFGKLYMSHKSALFTQGTHEYNRIMVDRYTNLLNTINVVVFSLWRYAINSNLSMLKFLERNFTCNISDSSYSFQKKIYTPLTSGVSHITLSHLLSNLWALNTIINSLKRDNSIKGKDIILLYAAGSISGAIAHSMITKTVVVGASGAVMSLLTAEAIIRPRDTFTLMFPIPGITLSSAQLLDVTIVTNFIMAIHSLISVNDKSRIAWFGHIFGALSGFILLPIIKKSNYNNKCKNIFSTYKLMWKNHRKISNQGWLLTLKDLWDIIELSDNTIGMEISKQRSLKRWRSFSSGWR